MEKVKVACIGDPILHKFLSEEFPQWDWQVPVETIDDFYEYLRNESISLETRAIFIYDGLFDPNGDDDAFATAVARFAPYAMIAILNYDRKQKAIIRRSVENAFSNNSWDPAPFFFIDHESPLDSINEAVSETIRNHENEEVAAAFDDGTASREETAAPSEPDPQKKETDLVDARQVVENNEKLGKVISITSSKGGSGKSTVAVSLASYIARSSQQSKKEGIEKEPLSVAIVDLDVRDGQLGFVTGKSTPTVLNIRLKSEDDTVPAHLAKESAIYSEGLGCDLYLAPKSPRGSEEVPPPWYNNLIQTLRTMYDYVILDTSVNYLDTLLEEVAYPSSDQIIFVTDLGIQSVFGMARWIREVTGKGGPGGDPGMGVNPNKIGIVVNKTMPGVGMTPDKIKKAAMGLPVLTNLPSMPTMVTAAANAKRLQDLTKNKEFNRYIRILSRAVVGKGGYQLAHIDLSNPSS